MVFSFSLSICTLSPPYPPTYSHTNIIGYIGSFVEDQQLNIVMVSACASIPSSLSSLSPFAFIHIKFLSILQEYADGGDLSQFIQSHGDAFISEETIWNILIQITQVRHLFFQIIAL